jgi:hypothetical protein
MSVLMQNLESRIQYKSTVVEYPVVAAFQVEQLVTLARPLESKTVEDMASTSYPMQCCWAVFFLLVLDLGLFSWFENSAPSLSFYPLLDLT